MPDPDAPAAAPGDPAAPPDRPAEPSVDPKAAAAERSRKAMLARQLLTGSDTIRK